VKASESKEGGVLDETIVKELTGGDTVSARFLFREHFDFRPMFKLWLATNHRPTIRGSDHAIWRRIRLIDFPRLFMGKDCDPTLKEQLRNELPGQDVMVNGQKQSYNVAEKRLNPGKSTESCLTDSAWTGRDGCGLRDSRRRNPILVASGGLC
jgi:hypothetical protein